MSTNTSRLRPTAVRAGLAGAAAIGVALAVAAPAHADAVVKLPAGSAHGDGLTLTRTAESAQISPSLAANGLGRTAWVSAHIVLKAQGLKASPAGPNNGPSGESAAPGTNGTSTDGAAATLSVGYIVGCQVNIGSASAGFTGSVNAITSAPTGTGTVSIPVTPGQVTFAQIDYKDIEKSGTYYFDYDRVQLQVQNCAGYAQARSFVTVETTGGDHQKVNLYGKPFSIG
ncbi:MspA family porin [Gordonia sp. NPDC003376]